ncbi:hypothetical protein [Yinghuangia seranimata]|uniref:hypothetical protein n=1 Tax=Yinghuangia seranimata TaxID=408067 RepID=UPI00248AE90B|nr:hypothetical protein [Yinghuangia seranimata]MDI2125449.1 hypothetical protein [Yinghuangia seranimata]
MSCWTAYILRDKDGRCLVTAEKQSWWDLSRADDVAGMVEMVRRAGIPAHDERALGFVDTWHCQAVAIDLIERRVRHFRCGAFLHGAAHADSFAAWFAAAPVWSGWDVGYAWGGRQELLDAVPQAAPAVAPDDPSPADVPLAALCSRDEWFVAWDAGRHEITVRYAETSADWFLSAYALISVIRPDNAVLDYRLDYWTVVDWLARHGDSVLPVLSAEPPYPLPEEATATPGAGVVIDVAARRVRYWTTDRVPPAVHERVVAAWTGWRTDRLPYGYPGHLACTGRVDHDVLSSPDQLLAGGWDESLLPHRDAGRRTLAVPSDTLRACRIVVTED